MTNPERRGWEWRPKVKWFAAEFLVVVTGVLVALALGAFFQQQQNGRSEDVYLSLLSRDVARTAADLEDVLAFERATMNDGLFAYRTISGRHTPAQEAQASGALGRLLVRRTLRLKDGTYQDLISTGNLRLIRNHTLRDSIVDFFESTTRLFDVINKNNSYYVDEMYNTALVGQGLLVPRATMGNVASLAAMDSEIMDSLATGYATEPDRLWSLAPGAREWAVVKSTLVQRIRVSTIAQRMIGSHLKITRDLKAAIDREVSGSENR
jgi:hypothetical protein